MTHSLHRRGSRSSLEKDFVWQPYPAKGINDDDLPEKWSRIIDIVEEVGTPNWGDVKTGPKVSRSVEEIRSGLTKRSRVRGVFTSKEKVSDFLRRMKEADIGLSVVVSGLRDEVLEACSSARLKPHSVNLSLGVWGKRELLAEEEVLEVTTMCGHHMVAPQIVITLSEMVMRGSMTSEEAGRRLAKLCPCGIFNQERAAELIDSMTEKTAT